MKVAAARALAALAREDVPDEAGIKCVCQTGG